MTAPWSAPSIWLVPRLCECDWDIRYVLRRPAGWHVVSASPRCLMHGGRSRPETVPAAMPRPATRRGFVRPLATVDVFVAASMGLSHLDSPAGVAS